MSLPPLNPEKTPAGISIDPRTLERVIPESRRADGTVRKERRVRPGFTPQEDVKLFQAPPAKARVAVPKGYVPGWIPPTPAAAASTPKTAAAKKNEKRRKKRKEKAGEEKVVVKENWEDEDEEEGEPSREGPSDNLLATADDASVDAPPSRDESTVEEVASKLDKLQVR